ncbi:alpha/beta fold hydrolase, partial [Acidisphaera sp. L21]|uniref:alpha/beta fold hydrolase n=1 Tax=Acidisphaera sp. L21 TaxID=1641851 RepID=UPI001C20966C
KIQRAHVVGLSMGGYATLQFGLRYPQMASALVAAGAGSGSAPADREAWLRNSPVAALQFLDRGMDESALDMGTRPTRIQLRRKDPRGWADFVDHLSGHSALGMSNTMAQYQTRRPSLHDFQDAFAGLKTPVLLAVGDEDTPCLETNLMLKRCIPGAGLWMCPNTGHAINLEEPAAFNDQVQAFFSAVERQTWPHR